MIEELESRYYAEVEREAIVREVAFLPVTENICGLDVVPMTLRHLVALRLVGSPFLLGIEPTPEDCFVFLWCVSPGYSPDNLELKREILKRCNQAFIIGKPPWIRLRMGPWQRRADAKAKRFQIVREEIRAYMKDAMQDRPAVQTTGPQKSYFSDAAAICHKCAVKYGWSSETTLSTPLKALFQYLKLIDYDERLEHKKRPIMFNPSDDILNQMLMEENRAIGEN